MDLDGFMVGTVGKIGATVGTGVSVVNVSSAGAGPEGDSSRISNCRFSMISRRNCRSSSSIDGSSISSCRCSR